MKTILITGSSSGFGLETAAYFLARGWRVIATMRNPRESALPKSENLRLLQLDVTDPESIRRAVDAAGPIDVLVNNAGIGLLNALEGVTMAQIRETFETNTFATMAMTQAVLPQLRERRSGVIINVSSSTTLKSLPLLSVYTASKAAINAFTECLALELSQFNIRVSLVIPGRSPETSFSKNAQSRISGFPAPYSELAQKIFAGASNPNAPVTHSKDVAEVIWQAANDPESAIRLPAGADAVALSNQALK